MLKQRTNMVTVGFLVGTLCRLSVEQRKQLIQVFVNYLRKRIEVTRTVTLTRTSVYHRTSFRLN